MKRFRNAPHYYCSSFLRVLGMYEHTDLLSTQGVITVYFPQDTENDYPDYTLVHELTHRDLAIGSVLGKIQAILADGGQISLFSEDQQRVIRDLLMYSMSHSRLVHEAIATYTGLIHLATTNEHGVKAVYERLPAFYRSALSMLERVLPTHLDLARSKPNRYRNILLAIGKFCLNTQLIHKLVDIKDPSVEELRAHLMIDSPDQIFQTVVDGLYSNSTIMKRLLDIVEQTAVESGFGSFDGFLGRAGGGELSRPALASFLNNLDGALMFELAASFPEIGNIALTRESWEALLNTFLKKWNQAFEMKYGHKLSRFDKIRIAPDSEARIRISPGSPEVVSGKRPFSAAPAPTIGMLDLLGGLSFAKALGLWLHVRMFINPGDRELPMGLTAPPLAPHSSVLIFAPCLPDTIRTDQQREHLLQVLEHCPSFCKMQTSHFIPNVQLPQLIDRFNGIPLLWHIDWIMYNFAGAAKIDVTELPGKKYIHMDNADDVTYFAVIRKVGERGKVEAYVQWFGERTLLVATFYRVGTSVFYSIPITVARYYDLLDVVASVGGKFLKPDNEDLSAKPFNYSNDAALLYHYGF